MLMIMSFFFMPALHSTAETPHFTLRDPGSGGSVIIMDTS